MIFRTNINAKWSVRCLLLIFIIHNIMKIENSKYHSSNEFIVSILFKITARVYQFILL